MRDFIVDGRRKPKGKNLGNRQRFIGRIKAQVKGAVDEMIKKRKIKDAASGKDVSIPIGRTEEPYFRHDPWSGRDQWVGPGNRKFVPGDKIPIPEQSGGRGSEGSDSGEGMDEFTFVLTKEEFLDLFFEDLELPDLVKTMLAETKHPKRQRAGFVKTGPAATIDLRRTMRNSVGRRIALGRPSDETIEEVEDHIRALEELEDLRTDEDDKALADLREVYIRLKRLQAIISYIDPIDIQHRRYEARPSPATKAVMFCLMDVSGSMTEDLKDLAKRFFLLLHVFLDRCYGEENVDIVFIRHASEATEVDEETFFRGLDTGGTVVSTALQKMLDIIRERYNSSEWNIYGAQASDGDNSHGDTPVAVKILSEELLLLVQYFAYIEVLSGSANTSTSATNLWQGYEAVQKTHKNFRMKMVGSTRDIYPVFRELFAKQTYGG